jgi:hypothetical protein
MKKLSTLLFFLLILALQSSAQVSPITGPTTVCTGSTITLSDATPGGTWSSFNTAIATIGSSGIVTGIAPGVDSILYTVGLTGAFVLVTVNTNPTLSSPLTPPAICDSTIFSYTPLSSMSGATFAWTRAFITGIAEPASSGTGNPDEQLINTTYDPLLVTYVYALTAGGCTNTQNVTVTVNPAPILSSALTLPALCDSGIFNYTPESYTLGTTFTWSRASYTGILESGSSGTGNPNEQLINTTPDPISVSYVYVLSANSCLHTQDVIVTLNPTPVLSSTLMPPAICDSTYFNYTPTSLTPGTLYAWNRPEVPGIWRPTAFASAGSGIINEILVDSTTSPIVVTYYFRLGVGGCFNLSEEEVQVTVDTCTISFVSNSTSTDETIKVYPNPASGIFTVEMFATSYHTTIIVSDIFGKIIETRNIDGETRIKEGFNLKNIAPGTYLVKICSGDRTYREKVLIW